MKRLRRWLFNGTAAVSLIFCIATVFLWIRSCSVRDTFPDVVEAPGLSLQSASQCIYVCSIQTSAKWRCAFQVAVEAPGNSLPIIWRSTGDRLVYEWPRTVSRAEPANGFGFAFVHDMRLALGNSSDKWFLNIVAIPYWAIVACFLWIPALWLAGTLKGRSRFRAGLCTVCGYDLRATLDRCPECETMQSENEIASN